VVLIVVSSATEIGWRNMLAVAGRMDDIIKQFKTNTAVLHTRPGYKTTVANAFIIIDAKLYFT
jgi:hypothetical protein